MTVPPEQRELLQGFVDESIDALDDNEVLIAKLADEDNKEEFKAIFRVFHTLKGLSGFFELRIINSVTHEAETLLDLFRQNPKPLNDDSSDLIYTLFDFLRSAISSVGVEFTDKSASDKAVIMVERIKLKIAEVRRGDDSKSAAPAPSPVPEVKIELDKPIQQDEAPTVTITLEAIEAIKNTYIELAKLKDTTNVANQSHLALKQIQNLSAALKEDCPFEVREILGGLTSIIESVEQEIIGADDTVISVLLSDINVISKLLKVDVKKLVAMTHEEELPSTPVAQAPIEQVKPIEVIEQAQPVAAPVVKVPEKPKDQRETKESTELKAERKDIRVSTDKLNKLFDLVGEIITIESMVVYNKDLQGLHLPNFGVAANMLNKLTRELQSITMTIRMMPLEGLFNKMTRLVRDLARKFGKKIDLKVSGQDTEMDKNVIEEISDPLVHLIRNALDHGVEFPAERLAKGKPEVGTVFLGAGYFGNEINIVIEDDGAGLNTQRILNKAISNGLLTAEDGAQLTDKEIWGLIFESGLSTAKEVTDVSGRGVGMDVVRRNIEKLHGTIDIDSIEGKGSRITLKIPLTLAIMDAMLVRVGEAKYAIPMLSIQESFRPKKGDITTTMDGVEVVKVRNELFPVIRLHEVLGRAPEFENLDEGILMIISSRGKKACLFMDEILGQQQAVVKGLSEYIGDVKGVTGCMVMADGKIGLILDVDSLVMKAEAYKG